MHRSHRCCKAHRVLTIVCHGPCRMADEHDVTFESADAGASLTYPQQAGTIRKNAFIVIKNRPCKVQSSNLHDSALVAGPGANRRSQPSSLERRGAVPQAGLRATSARLHGRIPSPWDSSGIEIHAKQPQHPADSLTECNRNLHPQVVDVSTSKTGKHGHAKCHFVAIDIFTGKKLEDLQPSSHNSDVRFQYHMPFLVSSADLQLPLLLRRQQRDGSTLSF